jgi:NAD(P)-dependent dehydrogenase (short-subunit alcohol dehydrogenase family)
MEHAVKKNYLITGSSGIAAETARLATKVGVRVFIVGKERESCELLCDELNESGESSFAVADLTDEAQVVAAVQSFTDKFGRIDALFNVAGISGRKFGDGPIHECTLDGWNTTLDTNAKTVFLMSREVVKIMMQQGLDHRKVRGSILNMGSILNFSPEPKHFATHAYAASKAAIVGLSQTMAAYYATHKIRVNVIAPSLVKTPMSNRAQTDDTILEYMKIKHPLGEEMLEANDVAELALFLMGDAAARITGETVKIDAGWKFSNV